MPSPLTLFVNVCVLLFSFFFFFWRKKFYSIDMFFLCFFLVALKIQESATMMKSIPLVSDPLFKYAFLLFEIFEGNGVKNLTQEIILFHLINKLSSNQLVYACAWILFFFTQEVLDSIEFARGASNSTWGSVRTAMGHEDPFNLKYIAVGNEDCWKKNYRGMHIWNPYSLFAYLSNGRHSLLSNGT